VADGAMRVRSFVRLHPQFQSGCTGFVCVIAGFKIMKPVKLKGASPYFWNTRLQTQLKQQNGMDVGHCI